MCGRLVFFRHLLLVAVLIQKRPFFDCNAIAAPVTKNGKFHPDDEAFSDYRRALMRSIS
jgi:hypothetical protein